MKKILLFAASMLGIYFLKAQTTDKQAALTLVVQKAAEIGLLKEDIGNFRISDTYYDKTSGTRIIYLQQTFKDIPVYNQLRVLAFKNDQLVSSSGSFIKSLNKKVNITDAVPSVTPSNAVQSALADRKLPVVQVPAGITADGGNKIIFSDLGVSRQNITAQLTWVPSGKNNSVLLAWQVYIIPKTTSDYWMVRVDAKNSSILGVDNYTVYCNWDKPVNHEFFIHEKKSTGENNLFDFTASHYQAASVLTGSPAIVDNASYRVIPFPAESPIHPGGANALVSNPWTAAPGNATSLKWNSNGTTNFTITRSNNVLAQEDRNNNNGTGTPGTSTTSPDPLTFNFVPNYAVVPTQTSPVQNQQFNITNLFYWNNIIHDITYQYGFDEVSGNFQDNNQGRGGLGNDYVMADAQDGGGTNNANFSTPADGSNGRMQMYLWDGSPQKDGDVDNGIISHEYAHGISTRLTGGPSQSSCLSNAEQMGEGWSDYYGLMYTQNWSIATLTTGFTTPRGVGTYVIGQTATGSGIRNQKYCTNFAINNEVYAASISAESHNRGEIWCATLWDMTWNIINQAGTINANIYDAAGGGGNTIALKLVTEGLKLQPCSPGFIDGRDAILQADQLLYNGAYDCAIREAFRRRGMGAFASQGSSGSVTDQVADYTAGGATLYLTQNGMTQVPEGNQITYTNTITTSGCAPLSNFLITDTLPSNVTYVSGGSYNAGTRVVSFPVNQAAGQVQGYSFTVQVNAGAYFPTVTLFEDNVPGATIPATIWSTASTTSTNWHVSNARSHSAPNSYYSSNLDVASDQKLFSTNTIALGPTPPPLSFWHWFNTESTYDGGVLEISLNAGTTWTDMGANIISGGYTGILDASTLLPGRHAWTGSSNNKFIKTKVNLTPYANQNVKFRFRFASDVGTNLEGWYVDDIAVKNQAVVEMLSSFFTSGGTRVATSDTITVITAPISCNSVAIASQPVSASACTGSNASFGIAATGDNPGYQWQVSTNGGTSYAVIAGQTNATLNLTNVTTAMNGNLYQVVISNTCPSSIVSVAALLSVGSPASITAQPVNTTICAGNTASFAIAAAGSPNSYQWQVSTDGGNTFTDIQGATTASLSLPSATAALNNNQYHVVVGSCSPANLTSENVVLTVNDPPAIVSQPASITICTGNDAVFTVNAAGTNISYQWQVSTNGGTTYQPVTGATGNTFTVVAATATSNNDLYHVVITGICPAPVTSAPALLTVSNTAAITAQPVSMIACSGSSVSFNATASGTAYQWQISTDGGNTFTNIQGATTTELDIITVTASMNNNQYRLLVSSCSSASLTSAPALLTVNDPATINSQPVNSVTCLGTDAIFTVTGSGTQVTYQWEVSTDNGISFQPISGAINPTLTIPAVTASMDNNLYRVILNNSCTVNFTSTAAVLSVTSGAVINVSPDSTHACENTSAAFSVSASGTGLTYQWQVSTDGGNTFINLTGEVSTSLNLTAVTSAMNNNRYRVIVFNPCSASGVTSASAMLRVDPLPVVVISASPYVNLSDGLSTTLTAVSTPASTSFQWFKGGTLISGATGNMISVDHNALGDYTASATAANTCINFSNVISIGDSSINFAFIYPNPSTGFFQVRFKTIPANNQARYISIYDAKGSRVFVRTYLVSTAYEVMDVHAEKLSTGVYMVVLSDVSGNTLGSGKLVIRY